MTTSLATRLMPVENAALRNVILAVVGSLIVAGSAQITVPFWPVPMTLQTLAVLLVGGAYGLRLGAATLTLYAFEGAIGLPFFSGGKSGLFDDKLDYIFPTPTLGYIAGFILAAAVVGYLAQSGWISSLGKMVVASLVGAGLIYVPGVLWLGTWFMATKGMEFGDTVMASFQYGILPFVLGDVIKSIIGGFALSSAWSGLKR